MSSDTLAIGVMSLVTSVATAAFYLIIFLKPDLVWAINAPENLSRRWPESEQRQRRWYHFALLVFAMLGTGICVNSGVSDLMSWMPKSWPAAESIAGLAGIICGFALPLCAVQLSSNAGQYKQEAAYLLAEVRKLQKQLPG
jgi:hypothetical protein